VSDDGGAKWRQAQVPVQSGLVALYFAPSGQGWAVGHDGVILHNADRGNTLTTQFDGRAAQHSLLAYYQARIDKGEKQLAPFSDQVTLNTKDGPTESTHPLAINAACGVPRFERPQSTG
jgi:photosystem II stability/assembly factor-like uncharacterized protein